jgi:hypothetical protein
LATKIAERRLGERFSEGLYNSLREILAYHSIPLSVRRKLAGIIAKVEPLSDQSRIARFLKNVDHAKILNGFVQDLAYAVTDYQVWDVD